jgi:hypothetical protein
VKLVLSWYLWTKYWYEVIIASNDTNLIGALMSGPLPVYISRFHTSTHTCCRSIVLISFIKIGTCTTNWRYLFIKLKHMALVSSWIDLGLVPSTNIYYVFSHVWLSLSHFNGEWWCYVIMNSIINTVVYSSTFWIKLLWWGHL